jgi:putative protease
VVKIYREALDSLTRKKWKAKEKEISKLKMCFNRGLTKGWLLNAANESIMGRDSPGNRGLYLGKVTNYNKTTDETIITLRNIFKPQKGDGILFKHPGKTGTDANIWGIVLEHSPQIKKDKLFLKLRKRVERGSEVFITRRKSMVVEAEKMVTNLHLPHRIPLRIQIKWNTELTPLIKVNASPSKLKNIEIEYKADFSMENAIKRPLSKETIIKHLEKTGGTPFIIKNIQMDYPGNLFTPIGNLNHLRREILEEVKKRILKTYQPSPGKIKSVKTRLSSLEKNPALYKEKNDESPPKQLIPRVNLAIYVDCISSLKAALELGCRRIYFQPKMKYQRHNGEVYDDFHCLKQPFDYETSFEEIGSLLKEAATLCHESESDLIWKWPDITNKNFIEGAIHILKIIPEDTINGVMVGDLGALWALKEVFDPVNLYGSGGLNIWNHRAIDELSESIQNLIFSPELSKDELKKVVSLSKNSSPEHNFEFLVQGNLEALVSEDCLPCVVKDEKIIKKFKNSSYQFLGIKDSKHRIFPVQVDKKCRTHILNSVELCLIDHLPSLLDIGLNSLVIDSRSKPEDYVRNMLSLYLEALELTTHTDDPNLHDKLRVLKKRVKKISNGGITTGNFLRGVKEDY